MYTNLLLLPLLACSALASLSLPHIQPRSAIRLTESSALDKRQCARVCAGTDFCVGAGERCCTGVGDIPAFTCPLSSTCYYGGDPVGCCPIGRICSGPGGIRSSDVGFTRTSTSYFTSTFEYTSTSTSTSTSSYTDTYTSVGTSTSTSTSTSDYTVSSVEAPTATIPPAPTGNVTQPTGPTEFTGGAAVARQMPRAVGVVAVFGYLGALMV